MVQSGIPVLLTREQEIELARRWRRDGDRSARDELVARNVGLAFWVAKTYVAGRRLDGSDAEDLRQQAVLGLCRAADLYDPDEHPGIRFNTYARHWCLESIRRYARDDRTIRLPAYLATAARPGESSLRTELRARARRLRRGVGIEGEAELLAGPGDPCEGAVRDEESRRLAAALDALPPMESFVLRARFGLDGNPLMLREIARRLGLSKEWVRRIERRALRRLRARLSGTGDPACVQGPSGRIRCAAQDSLNASEIAA